MLQANEAVAEFMCKREHPTVYRVHENPDPDKLRAFAQFARPFGYRIDPSKPEDTAQFQVVLRGAKNDPKQRVLPTLLLRSLARARYADECIGHYGLKAKFYLHFTSPIRRYPDLIAHRMLQKALTGEEFTAADENMCAEAAQQSTSREQAADNCERDIDKLFIAAYMKQFIGEEFDAEVSGVQSFGIFVALANGIFSVTYIIFLLTDMQMHNKMEIEGAASDAARPQAADFPCEAGRMRRFDSQICSLSGKNAAETARTRRYVNFKEVRGRRNGTANFFCVRLRPGAWHGLNCTRRCRSTANCWRCATRCGCARRQRSGTCACCGCGHWTTRRTATYPPCRRGSWRRSASSTRAGRASWRRRCARPGSWTRTGGCTTGATTPAA